MTFRLAFAKGRGATECMALLEHDGLRLPPAFHEGRLSVHYEPHFDLLCVLVRGRDIVGMLEADQVDAAIGSRLLFEEYGNGQIFEAAALDIGVCRFSLITLNGEPKENLTRIATRYPHLTAKMLNGRCSASLVELSGCVESALFLGLSDAITDIVETGWTLNALSLCEREVLSTFSHSIWLRYQKANSHLEMLKRLMPSVAWNALPSLV